MTSWNDPIRWAALLDGSDCPLCNRAARPGVLADLPSCVVTADEGVGVRGYCCLIHRRHVVELHQLSPEESAQFMADAQQVARAVQSLTGALKLNYEIHGNVVPHLHLHIVPRYRGDAIEVSGKGFAAVTTGAYAPGEFAAFTQELRAALTAPEN